MSLNFGKCDNVANSGDTRAFPLDVIGLVEDGQDEPKLTIHERLPKAPCASEHHQTPDGQA